MAERTTMALIDSRRRLFHNGLVVALVFALAIGAFAFRLAIISGYRSTSPDGRQYQALSQELIRRNVLAYGPAEQAAYSRLPGYPLFLAYLAVRVPCDEATHVAHAVLANVWLDLLSAAFCAIVAMQIARTGRAGVVSFSLIVLCPLMVLFASYALSESLATFLGAVAFAVTVQFVRRPGIVLCVVLGSVIGMAMLVRFDMATLLVSAAAAVWAIPNSSLRRKTKMLFACGLGVALTFGSWPLRNALVFGAPHFTASEWMTQGGRPLPRGPMKWMRTWAVGEPEDGLFNGSFVFGDAVNPETAILPKMVDNDAEQQTLHALLARYQQEGLTAPVNDGFRTLAAQRIKRNPGRYYLELPLKRLAMLLLPPRDGDYPIRFGFLDFPRLRDPIFSIFNIGIATLFLYGLYVIKSVPLRVAIAAAVIARIGLHMWAVPNFVCQRYMVELCPMVIVVASIGLIAVGGAMRRAGEWLATLLRGNPNGPPETRAGPG